METSRRSPNPGEARMGPAVLVAAAVLGALPGFAPAQEPETAERPRAIRVTGAVLDAVTGTPVAGAIVTLESERQVTMTSKDGVFEFEGVRPRHVALRVEQLGYANARLTTEVDSVADALRIDLEPMPVVLEGLEVIRDRLASRRKAVGVSARAIPASELVGRAGDMLQILEHSPGMFLHQCRSRMTGEQTWCVHRRGGLQESRLYVDDRPAIGGFHDLRGLPPEEVYAVEIYARGAQVRVYTRTFMAWRARKPAALEPIIFWPGM